MLFRLQQLLFVFSFNLSLFLLLMIGIQNSSIRKNVNLLITETITLPISFIIGVSFISGSLTGNLLKMDFKNKNDKWIFYNAINLSTLTILEIPFFKSIGATSLNKLVLGTLITFCSLLQDLFAVFRSK